MKIKEKGLTGKAATLRKESMAFSQGRKGFNAFKEMAGNSGKGNQKDQKGKEKSKPEVWLDFLGNKIRVYEEDGGTIKQEDVPYVKGASLKFEGVEGDVSFDEIKVRPFFAAPNARRLIESCISPVKFHTLNVNRVH
jgi:lupus La protein